MRVEFTVSIASATWSFVPGQVVRVGEAFALDEIPAAIADAWLACGHVVPVPPAPEIATAPKGETAAKPRGRRK